MCVRVRARARAQGTTSTEMFATQKSKPPNITDAFTMTFGIQSGARIAKPVDFLLSKARDIGYGCRLNIDSIERLCYIVTLQQVSGPQVALSFQNSYGVYID